MNNILCKPQKGGLFMGYDAGSFQVAVIGAGHAGIEAALAAARLGCETFCWHQGKWSQR